MIFGFFFIMCTTYFSIAVIKHHLQSGLWKEEFLWLMVPWGSSRWRGMAARTRSWAVTSSVANTEQREQTGTGTGYKLSKPTPAAVLFSKPSHPQLPQTPSTGKQGFRCMSFWTTFLIHATTPFSLSPLGLWPYHNAKCAQFNFKGDHSLPQSEHCFRKSTSLRLGAIS